MKGRGLLLCACVAVGMAAESAKHVALASGIMDAEPSVPTTETESYLGPSSSKLDTTRKPQAEGGGDAERGAGKPVALNMFSVSLGTEKEKQKEAAQVGRLLDQLSGLVEPGTAEALREIAGEVAEEDEPGSQVREQRPNVEGGRRVNFKRRVSLLQAIGAFVLASTVYTALRERVDRYRMGAEAPGSPKHSLLNAALAAVALVLSLTGREPVATFRYKYLRTRPQRQGAARPERSETRE
ncbi:hypothetical protein BESB_065930 [Besnoitia besnoiti]|uniref:Dense granule protein GRA11 n=1 Tax=Besnoitia besnoiti TaxID=94643 RepID=A0A2A9MGL4_BESBE|nr:hypothetical protein BESB_065930 [Besnoitia besnoiti]PFH34560.1 hypothetical protein BESB_065930 [Besnoitia besnoiti]